MKTHAQDAGKKATKTLEVNSNKWPQFCRRLEEFCRGAMVTIEVDNGAGAKSTVVQGVPLRHLAFDEKASACNANLVIEAGGPDQRPIRHIVLEPIHIRLKNGNGTDRYNWVQILAENGTTTVELHPGLNQALLDTLDL